MPYMSAQRYFGMAKEVTRGTPVSPPTIWIPIAPNPTLTPMVTWLKDDALRGSPDDQYDDIPLFRHDEFAFKGNVFNDTFPALLQATLGSTDTVTGTVAPYSHKIGLLNAVSAGSQPPSYTGYDTDNILEGSASSKQFADAQMQELSISATADGALTYTAKFLSNAFTEVAAPTSTWSTELFVPAWNGTVTFGTVVSSVIATLDIDIKRGTAPIQTIGSQSPYRLFAGPVAVSGKFTVIAEANDQTFTNSLSRIHTTMTCQFADPVSSHSVTFQMSDVQLTDPVVTGDKAWQEISANFVANGNTTDAVNGGYAPIVTTTTNAQSSAY